MGRRRTNGWKQLGWAGPGQDNGSSHQGPGEEVLPETGRVPVLVTAPPLLCGPLGLHSGADGARGHALRAEGRRQN